MRIEILTIPGCPNAEQARHVVRDCLQALNIHAEIIESVGDHPSPTVLIDGVDAMTGRTPLEHGRACRLDLPTHVKIVAALRSRVVGTPETLRKK
jgi:hypothetical protein